MRCSCLAVVSCLITLYLCWREKLSTCARTTTLAVSPENSDRDLQTVQEQETEKTTDTMADENNDGIRTPPTRAPHSQKRVARPRKGKKKKRGCVPSIMSKKISQTAKKLARWHADESLGQRKMVIVKDQRGGQPHASRPGNTHLVLTLS